ncbi:hypothetical protein [Viridibacterium curvum]|uniref:Energy-coupling factor transporter transmembrane protein EcfT n=1 Tax=Viridibacterium curvum TaxID=1101404 RepID=A0ABP9QGA7_9RHOO
MMSSEVSRTHPAVLVTAGLFCIVALQGLSGYAFWLLWLAVLGVAAGCNLRPLRRMLWRSKWIFLSILILFSWQTPGRAVLVDFWRLSPSVEGVLLSVEHAARLAGMIGVIVILMSRLQLADWVAALHVLVAPCRWLGICTDRFSVRLTLVLEAVSTERPRRPTWHEVLTTMDPGTDSASVESGATRWDLVVLSARDRGVLWLAWAGAFGAGVWLALS